MATIYKITSPDGRGYIGSTTLSLEKRMTNHRSDARLGKGNCRLYQAMRAGDPYLFTIEAIADVALDVRYQVEGLTILLYRTNTPEGGFNQQVPGRTLRTQRRAYRLAHPEIFRAQRQRHAARQAERRRWAQQLDPEEVLFHEVLNGVYVNE